MYDDNFVTRAILMFIEICLQQSHIRSVMIQKKETIFPVQDETAVAILNLNTLTQLRICEIQAYKVNNANF